MHFLMKDYFFLAFFAVKAIRETSAFLCRSWNALQKGPGSLQMDGDALSHPIEEESSGNTYYTDMLAKIHLFAQNKQLSTHQDYFLILNPLHLHPFLEGGWLVLLCTHAKLTLWLKGAVFRWGLRPQLCCSTSLTKIRA